ncbi:tetratricopeptide repeat protein [Lacipirellula parvula]|uniref:Tetratricopeptide repeat protein n=1 Tax=Lacipirellula parvula TaxID=2650471 RepID=A0A5K7X7B9_9BACT|nr:tetratricopeptide repeat protein [Lacipirellula parvula]BBO32634.1 hypothetical protein PLANPX_2246 [Lacipirellula parvula]
MTHRSCVHVAVPAFVLLLGLLPIAGCDEAPSAAVPSSPVSAANAAREPAKPQTPPSIKLDRVAALSTQWYPNHSECNTMTDNRFLREVVRQGVLMALREELGLVTRDESLGEPLAQRPPDAKNVDLQVDPLALNFHWDTTNVWHAELSGAGAPADNPIWKHDGTFKFRNRTFYAVFAAQMAELSEQIADQMRAAGAKEARRELNPANVPLPEIETQLGEMNFVSQFAAVRAAHRAMADQGPSIPWLGVLVRGYANLAMLTQHTWTTQQDAFAARSIVYAERMLQLSERSREARLHQAYAYAVIGMHGHALDLLAEADKQTPRSGDADPAWAQLIGPFAKFQLVELEQLAADDDELAELAALLRWHVYRSYMHGRWINDIGLQTMAVCPEAYSIYSVMANWTALGIKRRGASAAINMFGRRLPDRVAELQDLPKAARSHTVKSSGLLSRLLGGGDDDLSDRPMKIARALQTAAREEAEPTEFSWAVLGTLIAEEQFVEAVNLLKVSGDAVEHSRGSLVERFEPLVAGHRYAPYVSTFAVPPSDAPRAAEMMREVQFVDPRAAMNRMYSTVWHSPIADGGNGNEYRYRTVWGRSFTHPSLMENWYDVAGTWAVAILADQRRHFAIEFRQVSPHSPQAARMQWETAETYTPEQLAKWEQELREDPVGWMSLGQCYYSLSKLDDATRCYKRSVEISPCYDATLGLANCYYYNGKRELWKPTLESYLEVEDLGLAHAQIHQQIAGECIGRRSWREAEPHALDAAQTYSAWGLQLASTVYEGSRQWEESERFVAAASRSYPSYYSGMQWYLWCRRTGRGELDEARDLAQTSLRLAEESTQFSEAYRAFVYRMLEGEPAAAIAGMDQQAATFGQKEELWDHVCRLLHTAAAAEEAGNAERKQQALEEIRGLNDAIAADSPTWVAVVDALVGAFNGEELSEETLANYDKVIEGGAANGRCTYQYLMGAALDQQKRTDAADDYWRRALYGGPFDNYGCTLAGHELAEKYGADRDDLPESFAKLEAEADAAWAKSQAEADAAASAEEEDAEEAEGATDEQPDPDTTI